MLVEPMLDLKIEDLLGYLPCVPDALPRYVFCNGVRVQTHEDSVIENTTPSFPRKRESSLDPRLRGDDVKVRGDDVKVRGDDVKVRGDDVKVRVDDNTGDDTLNLYIADQAILSDPIYILHLLDEAHPSTANTQHVIHLGTQSEATIIEIFILEKDDPIIASTTITLDKDAILHHCILQRLTLKGNLQSHTDIHQKNKSSYRGSMVLMGGASNQSTFNLRLEEIGAESMVYGLYMAKGFEKLTQILKVDHQSPSCHSQIKTRGVATGRSTLSFEGTIRVQSDAPKSDASLENKNLLLSDTAQIITQPQLDIDNADVQCTHGATVGHLDEDALFYLQSRGLSAIDARALLIDAFIEPIFVGLSKPLIRFIKGLCDEP